MTNTMRTSLSRGAIGALLAGATALGLALPAAAATPNTTPLTGSAPAVVNGAGAYRMVGGHAAAVTAVPCNSSAPNGTSADIALAAQVGPHLTGTLKGANLTGARVACARAIVAEVAREGLDQRAATIAVTTAIVESTLLDDTSGDGSSVGLFQQLSSWGSTAQREDPGWATGAFLGAMRSDYPGNSWEDGDIGAICQGVQRSGFPDKYDPEAGDAAQIAGALWYVHQAGDLDNGGLDDVNGDKSADLIVQNGTSAGWIANHMYSGGNVNSPFKPNSLAGLVSGMDAGSLVASGDVSGDGHADLFIYSPRTDEVKYYPNNGNAFNLGENVAVQLKGVDGSAVVRLMAADISGDGHADLEFLTAKGNLYGLLNNEDGTSDHLPFTGAHATLLASGVPASTAVTLGDLDGDHKADLVFVRGDQLLYLHNDSGGLGLLANGSAQVINTGFTPVTQLVASDLSGDGHADLLITNAAGEVDYLPNNSGSTGSFFVTGQDVVDVADIGSGVLV
jgi:hypothetical protein